MRYYQQSIDWDAVKAGIDAMFPVRRQSSAVSQQQSADTPVFCERYTQYQGEVRDWLREYPAPVQDTKAVRFARVSKSLAFQGRKLHRRPQKTIPNGVDADKFVQAYVDRFGGAAESYNAKGETVGKFLTRSETLNFI